MTETHLSSAPSAPGTVARTRDHQLLPRRTYALRALGMGLAGLPLAAAGVELGLSWLAWSWIVLTSLIWPHVAHAIAIRSRDPFKAELRNFVIDSFLVGSWVPIIHFNLLPSVVLLTTATADKINAGVRGLLRRSLPGMFGAIVLFGLPTGFAFQPETSMTVILACLPIMVIHALAVSLSSYRLVRRVRIQNYRLEELSRLDSLTDLDTRGHWQDQAERLLKRHIRVGQPATLMLLDIDRFKEINDRFGHTAGDDVLRRIADLLRKMLRADCHSGRLGGDEFVVALPATLAESELAAERLRDAVARLEFPEYPGLRCSISMGLAEPPARARTLRAWTQSADEALYRAKHAGRNCVKTAPVSATSFG
jgi:diguanylate cyclase